MKTLKLALLGFGSAGRAFARLLLEKKAEIETRYDTQVAVTAIVTGSHGTLTDSAGLNLPAALDTAEAGSRFPGSDTAMEVAERGDYDALLELTPLNIRTGQPAIDHIKTAFGRGKHVVTANKGPIAWAYADLHAEARRRGCLFFYETTVMDGTPIFNLTEYTLKMARVTEVSGILNTTTNYMLQEMAAGKPYEEILAAGRRLGFIEADPAMDIEGFDAASKLTALLNVLMDAHMTPDRVDRTGIEHITLADIQAAAKRDCVIKLVCRGTVNDGQVQATVKPVEVPRGDLLATIDATSSVVSLTTDLMGKLSIVEHDPLIEQTAYGIFGDVLRVLDGVSRG